MSRVRFIDLFAGLGGFHRALQTLDGECVFASEIDPELRKLYLKNFPEMTPDVVVGDIREHWEKVPQHDILCAGFPCQPFSKSGAQEGTRDETRGTLFHYILKILERRQPQFVVLENVGNFARHDKGRTWAIVKNRLRELGYEVQGTEHLTPIRDRDWRGDDETERTAPTRARPHADVERGSGLISPHHFGYPQHRERFFVVASKGTLPSPPFPQRIPRVKTSLSTIVQRASELDARDRRETKLSPVQRQCIELWNRFVKRLPEDLEPPGYPLWSDEFGANYPFALRTPWATPARSLRPLLPVRPRRGATIEEMLDLLPSYARERTLKFRAWKVRFIRDNRNWWREAEAFAPKGWLDSIRTLPSSYRKLEWNVKGEDRDLRKYVLQFRPSGLRVKRYTSAPALVAMTATQVPVLGPKGRFITRVEGLRLQGFPDTHHLPEGRERAFKALGNAVHVRVVEKIVARLLNVRLDTQALNTLDKQVA